MNISLDMLNNLFTTHRSLKYDYKNGISKDCETFQFKKPDEN